MRRWMSDRRGAIRRAVDGVSIVIPLCLEAARAFIHLPTALLIGVCRPARRRGARAAGGRSVSIVFFSQVRQKTWTLRTGRENRSGRCSSPRGGDQVRVRSCGLAKNRGRAWRHIGIGGIEDTELCALFIYGPLLSYPSREQPILKRSGRIVEGPGGRVNGNFGEC